MKETRSGLAASICNAQDNETIDLAGKAALTIETAIKEGFANDFDRPDTIRITFVTGAGKLARQKYDEAAAKTITTVLRSYGYEEDSSSSAGTFKMQHDTGKNLKTVVVFPRVTGGVDLASGVQSMNLDAVQSLIPENTPEYKVAYSTMNIFQRNLPTFCLTWAQKRNSLTALEEIKHMVTQLDQKLLQGTPLSPSEQDFYDSVSMNALDEKERFVKQLMAKQVDDCNITSVEKDFLLQQVRERLTKILEETKLAADQPKKLEKLRDNLQKANERDSKLERIRPVAPPPLRHQDTIAELRRELAQLLAMEANAKGRLLTLKESQSLSRKDDIRKEIAELEQSSRGWFESDEAFQARVDSCRAATQPKKAAPRNNKEAVPSSSTSVWKSTSRRKAAPAANKAPVKAKAGGNNLFAAMMDSDSD